MLNWEDRYANTNGPVTSYRVVVDTPPPTPMSTAFEAGHLRNNGSIRNFPKPRFSPLPVKRKAGPRKTKRAAARYFTAEAALAPTCMGNSPHKWVLYGPNRAGTELARCSECTGRTTAANAGIPVPVRSNRRKIPVLYFPANPERIPPCKMDDHYWMKNGKREGVQWLKCWHCKRNARKAE